MTAPRVTGRAHLTDEGVRKLWASLVADADRFAWLVDYLIDNEPGLALTFGTNEQEFRAAIDIRKGASVMASKARGVS